MCNHTISGAGTGLFFCAKYTKKLKIGDRIFYKLRPKPLTLSFYRYFFRFFRFEYRPLTPKNSIAKKQETLITTAGQGQSPDT